jgi:hypothetical protein
MVNNFFFENPKYEFSDNPSRVCSPVLCGLKDRDLMYLIVAILFRHVSKVRIEYSLHFPFEVLYFLCHGISFFI